MKFNTLICLASVIASTKADGYFPGDNYSTFTPTDGFLDGATTQFTQRFGIAINPITSSIALSSVTTSVDGTVVVTQIGDGQIQATAATPSPVVVTQIGDGQIQASTYTPTTYEYPVVTQIGDGQIQATTLTTVTLTSASTSATEAETQYSSITSTESVTVSSEQTSSTFSTPSTSLTSSSSSSSSDSLSSPSSSTYSPSSPSSTSSSFSSSSTSSNSSTSSMSSSSSPSSSPVSSSSDDITTTSTVTPTSTVYSTVTSATLPTLDPTTVVVQKRAAEETAAVSFEKRDLPSTCSTTSSLSMTLEDSILYDSNGRIGAIVSNQQFQFDGPPPQAGSIYAAGWNIVNGKLALGKSTTFYQCLSGNFYNLYYSSIGEQCTAVEFDVIVFNDC